MRTAGWLAGLSIQGEQAAVTLVTSTASFGAVLDQRGHGNVGFANSELGGLSARCSFRIV